MSDSSNDTDDMDIASTSGLYALDALEGDVLRRFEDHLEKNPSARDEVRGFHGTAARLASTTAQSPPAWMRSEILGQLGNIRQVPVRLDMMRDQRRRRRLQRVASVAAAMVLIATVGLGGFIVGSGGRTAPTESASPSQEVWDMVRQPDAEIRNLAGEGETSARLLYTASGGRAMVVADGMLPPPAGQVYEVWHVRGDDVSNAGLFSPKPDGVVLQGMDMKLAPGDVVAVTVEPAGGSEAPTTPIIMSATV